LRFNNSVRPSAWTANRRLSGFYSGLSPQSRLLENGDSAADLTARDVIQLLAKRTHGTGGLVLLDCHGRPAVAFNTPRMAYGYVASDGSFFNTV
jgi:isoaspartyl peptidase/L-asparaginase-like protein (Ntn-hydrolase superfamily)